MNSKRIQSKFGSYGVDVLVQEPDLRIASLYSIEQHQHVTRSLAVVRFIHPSDDQTASVHARIVDGGSIGQSFVDEGFDVFKHTEVLVELAEDTALTNLYRMMHLGEPVKLAYHTYLLRVRKTQEWIEYARVTEVHSPIHLTISELLSEYGDSAYYREEHPARSNLLADFRGFFAERILYAG